VACLLVGLAGVGYGAYALGAQTGSGEAVPPQFAPTASKGGGVTIQGGGVQGLPTGANAAEVTFPVGFSTDPIGFAAPAPVNTRISNLRVLSSLTGTGETRTFKIVRASNQDTILADCTVTAVSNGCKSSRGESGTVPAGDEYLLRIENGPGGAINTTATWGFTLRPK
jgi:hypothetical protein